MQLATRDKIPHTGDTETHTHTYTHTYTHTPRRKVFSRNLALTPVLRESFTNYKGKLGV